MSEYSLITLTLDPALEESLIDWLLTFETLAGFSRFPVQVHSIQHQNLTLAEQVIGRKNQIRFQIHLPSGDCPGFLARLAQDFPGPGIHYWVSPLLDVGWIG